MNFFSIFFGINPCITAKFLVPPGLRNVSRTSFTTKEFSCIDKISPRTLRVIAEISFEIDFCLSESSFIFDSAKEYASLGICGNPLGMLKGLELKDRITLRIFTESSESDIIMMANFSFDSKSYLKIGIFSNVRSISL